MSDHDWRRMLFEPLPRPADPVREAVDPASRRDHRRRAGRLRDGGGRVRLNLTPMIDVVFQLLIFFVCTAQVLEGERIFRLEVPPMKAEADARASDRTPDPARIVEAPLRIKVRSADGSAVVSIEPALAPVRSVDELHDFLRDSMRRDGAGLFLADQAIEFDPDGECLWNDLVDAFNAVVRAGYRNVGFAGAGPGAGRDAGS